MISKKQFEQLLYRHAGADRKTAADLAQQLYSRNKWRWISEWGIEWTHQVSLEADKREGIATNAPNVTQDIDYRGAEEGVVTGELYPTGNPPPRRPTKRYHVKGFWWWDRFIEERNSPQ